MNSNAVSVFLQVYFARAGAELRETLPYPGGGEQGDRAEWGEGDDSTSIESARPLQRVQFHVR